jgi:penicillin-binding protein 1A
MGVRQSKLDEVPSLALGTSPVTLKEMVTSFATIANGGNYIEPQIVTAVEDRQHNVLESFAPPAPQQALQNQAAADAAGRDARRDRWRHRPPACARASGSTARPRGKTGTTQDNTDGWFIAMHPQLVAGAWMGFNDNRVTMRSEYWGQGAHNALFVVGDFLQQSVKAGKLDPKAAFAAPRIQDEPTLLDRAGDWWNSVFSTPPTAGDPRWRPCPRRSCPKSGWTARAGAAAQAGRHRCAGAPGRSGREPQRTRGGGAAARARVPAAAGDGAPGGRRAPVDTIPGTQVYRAPEASARTTSDPLAPADAGRVPGTNARVVTMPSASPSATGSSSTATSGGSTFGDGRQSRDLLTVTPARPNTATSGSGTQRAPVAGGTATGDGDSGSAPSTPTAPVGAATGSAGGDASQ